MYYAIGIPLDPSQCMFPFSLTVGFHAITVLLQSPIVRALALESVHVDAAYVAQIAELAATDVCPVGCHFEHAPTRQRLHDEQVLGAAGPPIHPGPG